MKGPLALLAAVTITASLAAAPQSPSAAQPPDPNVPVAFEAASVKPNKSGETNGMLRRQPGGRMNAVNMPLRQLIGYAYQTTGLTLVGGPAWVATARYDIVAKIEGDPPPLPPGSGPDQMMLAMRTLLAERFKLKVHRETRDMDAYALVLARPGGVPGPKLKATTQDCSPDALRGRGAAPAPSPTPSGGVLCGASMSGGRLQIGGMPIAVLLGPLGGMVGRSVVDRTGLTGMWDGELTFAPDAGRGVPPGADPPAADPGAPSIFTALQEQFGLKLETTKAPIEVVVIDSVDEPIPD